MTVRYIPNMRQLLAQQTVRNPRAKKVGRRVVTVTLTAPEYALLEGLSLSYGRVTNRSTLAAAALGRGLVALAEERKVCPEAVRQVKGSPGWAA